MEARCLPPHDVDRSDVIGRSIFRAQVAPGLVTGDVHGAPGIA
jgi:hypothetical protein